MDAKTVALVQDSWQKVVPIAPQAAALFYAKLFSADPLLKPLFRGNMEQQGARLMQMITAAVNKLDDMGTLIPILQNLGVRHVGYGVRPEHYDTVGSALLETLSEGLGDSFTPELKAAWTAVYQAMAKVMISAAY